MQLKPPPHIEAFRQQDREERLVDFMRAELDQITDARGLPFLIVARSGDSPVARATLAMGERIAELGFCVRIVFSTDDASIASFTEIGAGHATFSRELRVIRNPRLLDAHEQLVIGTRSVWFGDALRRDPLKRDAFEHFMGHGDANAAAAARAFERLWTATAKLAAPIPSNVAELQIGAGEIEGANQQDADLEPRPARH